MHGQSADGDAVQTVHGRCAGEMSDAAEVLSAIYDSLELVADGGRLIERLFQWQVHQFVECLSCGKRSHDTQYAQFFYNTFATALRLEHGVDLEEEVDPASLGTLLARVEAQAQKSCDTNRGRLARPLGSAPPRGLEPGMPGVCCTRTLADNSNTDRPCLQVAAATSTLSSTACRRAASRRACSPCSWAGRRSRRAARTSRTRWPSSRR